MNIKNRIFRAVIAACLIIAAMYHINARSVCAETLSPTSRYLFISFERSDNGCTGIKRFFNAPMYVFESTDGQQKVFSGRVSLESLMEDFNEPYAFEKDDAFWLYPPDFSSGIKCCDQCRNRYDPSELYEAQMWIEDASGARITPTSNSLRVDNVRLGTRSAYLCFNYVMKPKEYCENCGNYIGGKVSFEGVYTYETLIKFITQPQSVTAGIGKSATFEVVADYNGPYRWQKKENGRWIFLSDSFTEHGEKYSGTDTKKMKISGITQEIYANEYRCILTGSFGAEVGTQTVKVTPPATPTPTTTPVPATVTPAPSSDPPITPGPGSKTDYTPVSSTTSYVQPTPTPSSKGGTTTSSSSNKPGGGEGSYSGNITPPSLSSSAPVIKAQDPSSTASSGSSGKGSSGKSSSGSGKKPTTSSSSAMSSSSVSSTGRMGSNYITKNGVLYIIDDENEGIGTEGEKESGSTETETFENDEAYSAADLAEYGELSEMNAKKGFFRTVPGYITIGAIALLVLLLLMFFLFFGVIVLGEVEEHDEVFELCAIRLMTRRDGNWHVRLGSSFDDNAVLKLRIGLLFAVMFDGWDVICDTNGLYEGTLEDSIAQNMMLYRKNIRRSV